MSSGGGGDNGTTVRCITPSYGDTNTNDIVNGTVNDSDSGSDNP
jgi:hypothetical protein